MAWNEPGGGRKKDPWDGNDSNADVDAFLARLKSGFGKVFGGDGGRGARGNGGGSGSLLWIVLALLAAWFLFDSWQQVDERERGVVLRFGKLDRVMDTGLNFKWPRPIERVEKVQTTEVRTHSDDVRMLTRDENIVTLDFNVQYQVPDPERYLFGSRDPEDTLRESTEAAVREVMGSTNMDDILTGERAALATEMRTRLQQLLERYRTGILVTEFNLQNARPPEQVKEAFDDAISAREDKQRIENEAEAYASRVVPEARGDAARVREAAQAYRDTVIARAEGDAARFSQQAEAYGQAPQVTRKRLYLDTMSQIMAATPKVLVDDEDGNNILYLPLDAQGAMTPTLPGSDARVAPALEALPREQRDVRPPRRNGREGGRQ